MPSLLDSTSRLITADAVSQIAGQLGESDVSVSRGVQTGLSSVLAALANKADDQARIRQIADLATNRDHFSGPDTDIGAIVRGLGPTALSTGATGTFISVLFGNDARDVGDVIARSAGLTKRSSSASILAFVSALVLGFLGRELREGRLSLSSLTRLLAGERENLRASVPAGLLGVIDAVPRASGAQSAAPWTALPAPTEPRSRWVLPLVGGLAALALLWAFIDRGRTHRDITLTPGAIVESTLATGRHAVDTAAGTIVATRDLGAPVRRRLPGGRMLDVPENGIESRLIAYIEDPTRTGRDTTWFDFDRLEFVTGSARILPESQEQLDNIVAVLAAYPTVKAKVGGYTDNVGSPAANMRLSRARAEAVRGALTRKGIAATRLTAEGYGEQHAVADNATADGRARNRRIALRVTSK
jgi:OmpA-OmpF porin, OOP family